jgi:quinoprotein glucose dehydrogenase
MKQSGFRHCASIFRDAALVTPLACLLLVGACGTSGAAGIVAGPTADWPSYGGDPGGQRYSPLDQINKQNVKDLQVAWIYHTGDVSDGTRTKRKSAFENTPIVIDGTMYISTPFSRVIALDPETG